MGGGTRVDGSPKVGLVDLYVGGVEHAVLHLLYARFWHKVLVRPRSRVDDRAVPAARQPGLHPGAAYIDERGVYVEASEVDERDGGYFHDGKPVTREFGKMGKSLKNAVTPDDIYRDYGADTLRLYEMFMGPLDKERPWNTADIVGVHRFLQRLWRNVVDEETGEVRVADARPTTRRGACCTARSRRSATTWTSLSFNTAIARLFELNNHLTTVVAARRRRCRARSRSRWC